MHSSTDGTGQRAMTEADVLEILSRVSYEKRFRLGRMGDDGFFVQISYQEPDIRTGELAVQRGRKWYISPFATESEVVQTCLRAALDSAEHQVREHFGYRPRGNPASPNATLQPKLIYGPHFDAATLWSICGKKDSYDAREDPE